MPAEDTKDLICQHSKHHKHWHVCLSFSRSQVPQGWSDMSPGVCTCGGSGSHLRNTELGKSTIFTPSNKQAYELGDWDWHIYTTMYKKDNLSYSTGNSTLGSLVTYRGREFKNKAVRMFMYGWFTLLNSGNWHHGVKQFYFNFFLKKKGK